MLQQLGADLNRVRQTVIQLLSGDTAIPKENAPEERKTWSPPSAPSCPWCSLPLEGALAYRTLLADPVDEEGEPISLFVLYCKSCGGVVRTSLD